MLNKLASYSNLNHLSFFICFLIYYNHLLTLIICYCDNCNKRDTRFDQYHDIEISILPDPTEWFFMESKSNDCFIKISSSFI